LAIDIDEFAADPFKGLPVFVREQGNNILDENRHLNVADFGEFDLAVGINK